MARLKVLKEPAAGGDAPSCSTGSLTPFGAESSPSVMAEAQFAGNVLMVTLGCAKNQVDSEVIVGSLVRRGFRPVAEAADADLIVVNTCAFLESAVREGIDKILDLSEYKKNGRCRRLVVAGCMVERYRSELEKALPEVDRFVSTDELLQVEEAQGTSEECFSSARRPYFIYDETMPRMRASRGGSAYIKIAEGCDRPCAFCIIPKIRGSFRSRPVESVAREVGALLTEGVREVNLVAQDLTAYGSDRGAAPAELFTLLKAFRQYERPGAWPSLWTRLLYAYPIGVTDELIDEIASSPVICSYLDMPLQHIADPVLKAMRRPLGERRTRELIERIRTRAPEVSLRTTLLVGFPGETEEDIRSLESFLAEGHFTHVGVFAYSHEEESYAGKLDDNIPKRKKEERKSRVLAVQQSVASRRLDSYVGKEITVLLEGAHADTDMLRVGRAEWQAPEVDGQVIINDVAEDLLDVTIPPGVFGRVEVTERAGLDLVGRLTAFEGA